MNILLTIGIIAIILWALGLITSVTFGGLIHLLVVVGIILIILHFAGINF